MHSTRQIFDRLAHSSIMRLNESSMDKVSAPCAGSACWLGGACVCRRGLPPRLPIGCSLTRPRISAQLYDLITMGFKYQLIASSYPQELVHVTLNHLYQLRAKVEGAAAVAALIDDAIRLVNDKYAAMSVLEFAGLKHTLCRFFADKKVTASLFLQDGLQRP